MEPLLNLAKKYPRTDKFWDSIAGHSYGEFYTKELEKYRNKPISILEIGIKEGDSLRLWRDYFTNAKSIVGIDNHILLEVGDIEGVELVEADAYSEVAANQVGFFDIIIEDGLHSLESQLAAVKFYLPKLNPDGLFVIEDVQQPQELFEVIPNDYRKEIIDLRERNGRHDDVLVVAWRNPFPYYA